MRIFSTLILLFYFFGCSDNENNPKKFVYEKDDFWIEGFRNGSLPSKTLHQDKIYCSSINVGNGLKNYLYCLNLKTGKVDWVSQVADWASQPPIVKDSFIYFCSYVGDIYKFNMQGLPIWKSKLNGSFAGFSINPNNNNLFVKGLESGLYEYDFSSGLIVNQYGEHTMDVSLPIFTKNLMIIGGLKNDSAKTLFGNYLFCLDVNTRKETWKIDIGEDNQGIFIDSNKLYYISKNPTTINCIDVNSGKALWKHSYIFSGDHTNLYFETSSILYYQSDLSSFHELSKYTGDVIRDLDYYKVRNEGMMKPHSYSYKILTKEKEYSIIISDSLETPVGSGKELNIYIKVKNIIE